VGGRSEKGGGKCDGERGTRRKRCCCANAAVSLLSLLFAHHYTAFPILEAIPYYYLYANKIPPAYEFWVMIYMSQNTPKNVSRGIKFFTLLEFQSKNMRMSHIKQLDRREESQTKHTERKH
jgi:hypothetical protein